MKQAVVRPLLALLLAMPLHGSAQMKELPMYLNEDYVASDAGNASYALRTPPVRDDKLGAWHVLLEFADQPGRVAMESWTTDLDLSQAKFVHLRRWYFENGQLAREVQLDRDGQQRPGNASVSYYPNGQLKQRVTPEGQGNSVHESWHENGQLMNRLRYHGEQMADGEVIAYGPTGKVSSRSHLRGGKLHGLWEVFHQDGSLYQRAHYVDDRMDGEFVSYAPDGSLRARTIWRKGEPDGWSFESHDNGVVAQKVLFQNGAMLSVQKWGRNGQPGVAWQRDAQGREQGDVIEWYENGQRASVIAYLDGQRHGLTQTWYKDGQLQQVVPYQHGIKHGVERAWGPDGRQTMEQQWRNGEPVGNATGA
ncbi:toxin-antitoxin system YwqK family antitoxin [Janthinobacterium aquaticum]|uniref:toxin-antitoxin system YwqK family antitoxin n=1 Tax=Janthinobacterium sp. FT58W TaxID=2654254 RepID=UPI001263F310|nr:toxin-antitoxin system YwqK family antitoxin [Janthinobacterium sp. FT58W]KAB8036640.1 hypothetical protein GCM43_24410 [Janthinobacterium sp. FT58W]